ncbi:MAG: alpha-2-macroglobulin family protein [Actinomycetota bacterium]
MLSIIVLFAVLATACSDSSEGEGVLQDGTSENPDTDSSSSSGGSEDESSDGTDSVSAGGTTEAVRLGGDLGGDADTTVMIELSDAVGDASGGDDDAPPRETTVDGSPLGDENTARLLDRLPDLDEQVTDRTDFNRPPETRPRPRPGDTVDQVFPPPPEPPPTEITDAGPLEVLRFQPEGDVDVAPFISVTFNQPMIALGTLDAVETADVPISITPEMPGRWIWLGTKTARFEYERDAIDRIPAATEYEVTIDAGTTSLAGGELSDEVSFAFSTPAVVVQHVSGLLPSGMELDPVFLARFNQVVDPEEILEVTTVAAGDDIVAIRLAADDEIIERYPNTDNLLPGRWMAFRPSESLPKDTPITLTIGPAIPSAEGPILSDQVYSDSGRTYAPLRLLDIDCWGDCPPGSPIDLRFNNRLDPAEFTSGLVSIDPPVPGAAIGVSHDRITIRGATSGRTLYTVTVTEGLTDIFGQSLDEEAIGSIRTGSARPALFGPRQSLVTLDPVVADNRFGVNSINHDEVELTVWEVDPADDWAEYQDNAWRLTIPEDERNAWNPPWERIATRSIATGGDDDEFVEVAIDLSAELERSEHLVVLVEVDAKDDDYLNQPAVAWVQRTAIAIDAYADDAQAVASVTDLRTGEPIVGADVRLLPGGSARTDADGLATIELANDHRGALAEYEGDRALIGEFWASRYNRQDRIAWYVIDDRGLYRPGETVSVKGWVRRIDAERPARLSLPEGGVVSWFARDGFGNEFATGEVDLSAAGGFDLTVDIPTDVTLGYASISFSTSAFTNAQGSEWWHELQIQEFRRPDFEVSTEIVDAEPHFLGDELTIETTAEYFAGGPLGGSEVNWQVEGSTTSYRPPGWSDFDFGIWVPWWFDYGFSESAEFDDFGGPVRGGGTFEFWSASTDGSGQHALSAAVSADGKPQPVRISASATVTDVNRQSISSSAGAMFHPADRYVGLRGGRTFVPAGEPLDVDVIVTDLDGEITGGDEVIVLATRSEWRFENGSWQEFHVTEGSCEITSTTEPERCTFEPEQGGNYTIAATVTDGQGRTNLTEITRWVPGGTRPQSRRVELESLTLVPEGDSWQPGDVARVLVQSPFADAHGLVVISRTGIDRVMTFDFDDEGTAVLEVPILDDDVPGVGLQIEAVGSTVRAGADGRPDPELPPRPAFASGQLTLAVPPDSRELSIDVAPRLARLEPGSETQVEVTVTGPDGEPVEDAELAVIVVDEAVLSLTGYQLRDPLAAFYGSGAGQAGIWRGRSSLVLSDPDLSGLGAETELTSADDSADSAEFDMVEEEAMADGDFALEAAPAPQAARAEGVNLATTGGAQAEAPIEIRTNFDALAVFQPEVTTDADGKAVIEVPLPDNLTRYRVMVVATSEATDAGSGDSNITARLPVTVRPTPPRFANFGDRFAFPVVVQNATDDDLEIDVAFRSTNLVVDGRDGTTVMVPANDRVEVRFDVAADEAGTARFQIAASSGSFADAAEGSFPVYTPATAEAFATYGVVDDGSIAQPITEPQDVFPQFGGLEISTSSTAVSALTDAVIYMNDYRYRSSDALASRIIAIVALDDVLEAFESDQLPTPDELRQRVNGDIDAMLSLQNFDGGFATWERGRRSWPYNTVHATHALVLARDAGFAVPEDALANALSYLANIEDHMSEERYSPRTRRSIGAYALHVRHLAGDNDVAKAERIFDEIDDDQLDVAAWLWPVLEGNRRDGEIELLFRNRVTETPNAATFATDYGEDAYLFLHSDRRTDAIVLDAFLRMRPDSDLVLKTLNGILSARSNRGYWGNISENSFVLLAGSAYFERFENVDPDFIARAWLGETYAVEHVYEGRSTDVNATLVPMGVVVDEGDTDIVLAKDGDDGRLYYRLGLRYAPTDFDLEPRDQGFVVDRMYEAVDDPDDVVRNDDGTWTIKAGARVRIRLTMVADSRRTHVALLDPMPAGFEALNPALATTEPIPAADPAEAFYSSYWWYRWFDHQNLRDDRVEAFSTWLGAGSYEYTYVARATTPGTFVVPPTRAEQIYEPEVFGRSSNTTVSIVD